MTEINLLDLLTTFCVSLSLITFTKLYVDVYRSELRVSTKIFVVVTLLVLFGSLGYAFYDLFKGGVRIVY